MTREPETVSERVIHAVAKRANSDPLALPSLYSAIDPDALNSLVSTMADGEVVFCYAGFDVTVASDGTVTLEEPATERSHVGTATAPN